MQTLRRANVHTRSTRHCTNNGPRHRAPSGRKVSKFTPMVYPETQVSEGQMALPYSASFNSPIIRSAFRYPSAGAFHIKATTRAPRAPRIMDTWNTLSQP